MKVHFIKRSHIYELKEEIEEWIQNHSEYEIVDIQYAPVPWYSSPEYSVMIIYR